jgi:superfamily II DNA or RNA helicase
MQTVERFQQYGLKRPAVIWQKHPLTDSSNPIQIASVDTLIRREWPDCDLLIVDEAHLKRVKLLERIKDSDTPVIGLTATPFPAWMGQYYSSLIKTKTTREMIDESYLSDYDMYGSPVSPDLSRVKVRNYEHGRDYDQKELGDAMSDKVLVGDIVTNWLAKGENEPTIAFCVNVSHANAVTVDFTRVGIKAEVITAKTPFEERTEIFERFRQGVTKVLVSVGCLIAGFDEDVRCIIFARPTKSEMLYVQAIGRGLRLADGKERCIILEHSGTYQLLGMPCSISIDELKSSSNGDSKDDKRKEEELKKEKLPKKCTQCHHIKPPGVYECPKCGFKPIAGEDVETEQADLTLVNKDKKDRPMTMAEKRQFHAELLGYYKEQQRAGKRWSKYWVSHKYKDRTGVWPKGMGDESCPPSPSTINWLNYQFIKYREGKKREKV